MLCLHFEYYTVTPAYHQITIGHHKSTNFWQLLLPFARKQPFHHIFHFTRYIASTYYCILLVIGCLFNYVENPYIRAVSQTQLVVTRGESATLIFLIATDSDGATWNNMDVKFYFTDKSGEQYPIISGFRISRPDFPQSYIYTIPIVDLSDAGVYTASAPSM